MVDRGTTSACAENTSHMTSIIGLWRNYLRVRGEYRRVNKAKAFRAELPPRARRIPQSRRLAVGPAGTTSACAENTRSPKRKNRASPNYLRVRGEYALVESGDPLKMELPPRARRIPSAISPCDHATGTTSACAENTHHQPSGDKHDRNYLRVRGEYGTLAERMDPYKELPPRARRIR